MQEVQIVPKKSETVHRLWIGPYLIFKLYTSPLLMLHPTATFHRCWVGCVLSIVYGLYNGNCVYIPHVQYIQCLYVCHYNNCQRSMLYSKYSIMEYVLYDWYNNILPLPLILLFGKPCCIGCINHLKYYPLCKKHS